MTWWVGLPHGRDRQLKKLRDRYSIDFVIVNGENAAGGFGITPKICNEFFDAGADAITTGNHVDQKDIIPHFDKEPRILRPANFPRGTPGKGMAQFTDARGRKVVILHLMARLFMDPLDDPFAAAEEMLNTWRLGANADAIVLDFHRGIERENGDGAFPRRAGLGCRRHPHAYSDGGRPGIPRRDRLHD